MSRLSQIAVGVVALLVVTACTPVRETGPAPEPPVLPSWPEVSMRDRCHPGQLEVPQHPGTGQILAPASASEVEQAFVVSAKVAELPAGSQAWTILQVVGPAEHAVFKANGCLAGAVVWPGPGPLVAKDGVLQGFGFCGGGNPADVGLTCRLVLVVADAKASAVLAGGSAGLAQARLAGVEQIASVLVTRGKASARPSSRAPTPGPVKTTPAPSPKPCVTPVLPIGAPPAGFTGQFIMPSDDALVEAAFAVKVQATTPPAGWQLWTVLQVTGPAGHPSYVRNNCVAASRIWPGPAPLAAVQDGFGQWAICGGSADHGLQCRLILVFADAAASTQFASYNSTAAEHGYPGLAPASVTGTLRQADSILINRR